MKEPTDKELQTFTDTVRFIGWVMISVFVFAIIVIVSCIAIFYFCVWVAEESEKEPAWTKLNVTDKKIVGGGRHGPSYIVMSGDVAYLCNQYRFNEIHVGENNVTLSDYCILEVDID